MAHAEKLSEQVKALTLKVQELESALAQAKNDDIQATGHDIVINDVSKAIGSLSIGSDGQTRYHGESAGSEYFQDLLPFSQDSEDERYEGPLHLSTEIIDLMNSFPFGPKDCSYPKSNFLPYIPTQERAVEIVNIYYAHVAWMYDPIVREDLMVSILNPIYSTIVYGDLETIHSHRLAVFFMVLANGFLYDTDPAAIFCARQYQALGRAALSLDSLAQEVTCATVQTFFLVVRFAYNSDRRANEERWLLTGLAARLAQIIGLQRDSEGWNLDVEEVQRRRRLFWELFTWDSWTAIVNGRPPALLIQYADCQFPEDLSPSIKSNSETELGWHAWKFRYAVACLAPAVRHIFSVRTPPYAALLELDKAIRGFSLPAHLRSPGRTSDSSKSWSPFPSCAMQQYCALCVRESNLLYIHRSYFAQAIRQDSKNPLRHIYAPSVLATYRSACRLISALRGLFALHPQMTGQIWFFWSGIYSACIVLGALVVESPGCTLAKNAIEELNSALPFYEEGSTSCRPPKSLAILLKLRQRAVLTYNTFLEGSEEAKPRNFEMPGEPDELEVLGGRNTVISRQTPSNSPSYCSPGPGDTEDDDNKNPASSTGAAEMLVEYFEELRNPNLAPGDQQLRTEVKDQQLYMQQNPYYQHISSSNMLCSPYQGETILEQPAGGTAAGKHAQADGIRPNTEGLSGYQYMWEGQNGLQYHPSHVGRPATMEPALYAPQSINVYQYPFGQEHGQTQDEIWRNFVSGYGGQ
ncbi:hypothetical protein AX15_002133 [Amanita polypyramis BW_CC]|nr:hypothetical protein AX15_002133 [Amanita polypyramis BW_CC]